MTDRKTHWGIEIIFDIRVAEIFLGRRTHDSEVFLVYRMHVSILKILHVLPETTSRLQPSTANSRSDSIPVREVQILYL